MQTFEAKDALVEMESLDMTATVLHNAMLLGKVNELSAADVARLWVRFARGSGCRAGCSL
jgi:hypothetical protein